MRMKKEKSKTKKYSVSLWKLFVTFFKVGAFTFGGGYAMIAILEDELVAKKKWITSEDMLDMLVIAESTPGVIAVNTATSVGYRVHGFLGALVATLGVVLPSFLIIFGLSFAIEAFQDNTWYKAAFTGIQACVTILIVNAFIKMSKQLNKDVFSVLLLLAAFAVAVFTDFNVIFLIFIGGVLGVIYSFAADAVKKKKENKAASEGDGEAPDGNENSDDDTTVDNAENTEAEKDSENAAVDNADDNLNNEEAKK